jgi:hypothetical protein
MTDLEKAEIVAGAHGGYYRFTELRHTADEATELCKELVKKGFEPAYFQRKDNGYWEVFVRLNEAEEVCYLLERKYCSVCNAEKKLKSCNPKGCDVKLRMEDAIWMLSAGFKGGLHRKLEAVRKEVSTK